MPQNGKTTGKKSEEAGGINVQEVTERITDIGERIQSGLSDAGERLHMNEATVPDAFRRMPKFISPKVHAWLDVATTAYFAVLGIFLAGRGKGGAATAAFVNAGMVGGVSALTDYEGTGKKPINFKLHGTLDAVQATTAALGPVLHGFADEPEAALFWGQSANELAVIASTNWDAGMPAKRRRRAA